MVGRSLTLKIMKRDPSAPVEPPKVCCSHHDALISQVDVSAVPRPWNLRSIQQAGSHRFPWRQASSDAQIIGDHAWRLLKSFNFDPRELRGIGIQIQKLESASSSTSAPAGQAVLPFQSKAVGSSKAGSSRQCSVSLRCGSSLICPAILQRMAIQSNPYMPALTCRRSRK